MAQWGTEPAFNAGDIDSMPGFGSSAGEGIGNPLQYPHLGNPLTEESVGL